MSSEVLVSTVIPTRNRAALLSGAVRSALAQKDVNGDFVSQQIIISDDSSSDDTPEIAGTLVREYPSRVFYHRVRTGTPGGTRNAGSCFATGRYLAFLDDDDVWLPERLIKALSVFAAKPDVAFVYGQARPADSQLRPSIDQFLNFPPLPLPEGHPVGAFMSAPPHLNATLFRRDIFEEVGGFDETLSGFEDGDLLIRIIRKYSCATVQEPLTLMRFHTDGLNNASKMWRRYQDETRARRFHLSVRDAHRPKMTERVRLTLQYRGWYVHQFLQGVAKATRGEDIRNAIRYALIASPLHALKSPLLWRALQRKGIAQ